MVRIIIVILMGLTVATLGEAAPMAPPQRAPGGAPMVFHQPEGGGGGVPPCAGSIPVGARMSVIPRGITGNGVETPCLSALAPPPAIRRATPAPAHQRPGMGPNDRGAIIRNIEGRWR